MTLFRSLLTGLLLPLFLLTAVAQEDARNPLTAFRMFKEIDAIPLTVPTVVEIPFDDDFLERREFAVQNLSSLSFEPSLFLDRTSVSDTPIQVSAETSTGNPETMTDDDPSTFAAFALPEDRIGETTITLTAEQPVTSSSLTLLLDAFVALPLTIEIRAGNGNADAIVVARSSMSSNTIRFPETVADTWTVSLAYGQPLRIAELRLSQNAAPQERSRSLRFLAQPDTAYRVYFDPDRFVAIPTGEAPNLSSNVDVLTIASPPAQNHPLYTLADADGDGAPDLHDNCVQTANPDQKDIDGNGRGDACDDWDKDGVINSLDNCPEQPNRNQLDTDADGLGDVCDDEESRVTEKYVWLPWAGMGFAALVLLMLLALMMRPAGKASDDNGSPPRN